MRLARYQETAKGFTALQDYTVIYSGFGLAKQVSIKIILSSSDKDIAVSLVSWSLARVGKIRVIVQLSFNCY